MTKDQIIEQIEKSFRDYKGSNEAIDDAAFYIELEFKKYKNTDILPADVTLLDIKMLRELLVQKVKDVEEIIKGLDRQDDSLIDTWHNYQQGLKYAISLIDTVSP